jgi:hypothetical protein
MIDLLSLVQGASLPTPKQYGCQRTGRGHAFMQRPRYAESVFRQPRRDFGSCPYLTPMLALPTSSALAICPLFRDDVLPITLFRAGTFRVFTPPSDDGYVPGEGEFVSSSSSLLVSFDTLPRSSRLAVMLGGETHRNDPEVSTLNRWLWSESAARPKPKLSMSVLGLCRDIVRRVVAF